jgi:hydrogenase maturation protease
LTKTAILDIVINMKIVICGMGNINRGDDGFGPYVVACVKESKCIKTIDCNIYPENYLNKIVSTKPNLIVFLDTIKKNASNIMLLKNEEILQHHPISVSTHNLPFSSIYQFLRTNCDAEIFLLGISVNSYETMSSEVKNIADRVCSFFNSIDRQKKFNIIAIYENLSTAIE